MLGCHYHCFMLKMLNQQLSFNLKSSTTWVIEQCGQRGHMSATSLLQWERCSLQLSKASCSNIGFKPAWGKKRNFKPRGFMVKNIETKQNSRDIKNAQYLHCLLEAQKFPNGQFDTICWWWSCWRSGRAVEFKNVLSLLLRNSHLLMFYGNLTHAWLYTLFPAIAAPMPWNALLAIWLHNSNRHHNIQLAKKPTNKQASKQTHRTHRKGIHEL